MNKAMAFFFGLIAVFPVHAQTLSGALEQAWLRHPQAATFVAREAEAQARADLAGSIIPGPASVSLDGLSDKLNQNRGRQEWAVELAVPLWLPGQKSAREAEADSAMRELAARRAALRLQIAGEMRDAWWAVASARNARDLTKRRIGTARALESDVLRRYQAGDLARIDANLAQNERLAAEAEQTESELAVLQAEQVYLALTGVSAPEVLAAENEAALHELKDDHPQLLALVAVAEVARAKQKVAEQTRRDAPELAMRMERNRADFSESYGNAVGMRLTIPFSSDARSRQSSAAALVETSQADAELALAQVKLKLDVERARLGFETAERQLAMSQQRRDLTADNLRLAEKSFSLGESDLSSLLRVRANAFEAEALFSRQQVGRAAALSRLKQALGVLP